jgi:hypothetical protein
MKYAVEERYVAARLDGQKKVAGSSETMIWPKGELLNLSFYRRSVGQLSARVTVILIR